MTKEQIEQKLAQIGKDRHWLAEVTGYTYSTLTNRLAPNAKDLTYSMQTKITQAFERHEKASTPRQIVIKNEMEPEKYAEWERAGIVEGDSFSSFALSRLERFVGSINSMEELNIAPIPKKANLMAAAGSGIQAEVINWEGGNDTVNVEIYGLSMLGTFDDGDVITMRHKKASRSLYMNKGVIYLVEYNGGYMIKEYNTREPTIDERGADYIQDGTVKLLKSHNPDKSIFPDIIITQEIEWFAWYESM